MDQEVAALPRGDEQHPCAGHPPGCRCPQCWMGKIRRPFRTARGRARDVNQLPGRPGGTREQDQHVDPSGAAVPAALSTSVPAPDHQSVPVPVPETVPPSATANGPAPESSAIALDREVRFGDARYPVYVRSGPASWHELAGLLTGLHTDRFLLVTDDGVPAEAVRAVARGLDELAPVTLLRVPADERAKNLSTIDDLAKEALTSGATRMSVFVALGGGLAGNVAGLLAHLFLRGARLVHIPTTLLAMSDSVLSLKQAVNSPVGKNHLGAFHAPELVWSQLDHLATLPPAQIRAALCEAIKNIITICPERYDEMAARLRADAVYSQAEFAWFIGLCLDAKQKVMAVDPHEMGRALVLEYGHTVGHAAELVTGGRFSHGLAIGVGGLAAARIATLFGIGGPAVEEAHETLLLLNGAPTYFRGDFDADRLMHAIRLDNKRGYLPHRLGCIDMILLAGLGQPHQTGDSIITQVPEDVVLAGIHSRISRLPSSEGQS
jgi:3-dehydroquinate synthetase